MENKKIKWTHSCEYCNKRFNNEHGAIEHEKKCHMKPNIVGGTLHSIGGFGEGFKFGFGFGLGIICLSIIILFILALFGFSLLGILF